MTALLRHASELLVTLMLLSDQIFAFLNAKNSFLPDERMSIIDPCCSLTRECSEINVVVLCCLQCHWEFDQLGNSPH